MSAKNEDEKIKEKINQEVYIMKLRPLGDRVVLKQSVAEEPTKSGTGEATVCRGYRGWPWSSC